MRWALVPILALFIIPVGMAYADTTEEIGKNYNQIIDWETGIATWTSHPERIMINGEWENYSFTNNGNQVIFKSNSIGGLIYDKSSCSYSIYDTGFDGEQIIPSVSIQARSAINGTDVWSNMAVNNQSCDVDVIQNDKGIIITSTKLLQESETLFSANGTQISANPYDTERLSHELKLDVRSGIKETFRLYNIADDTKLGISQTVHTGNEIRIGDTVYDVASVNGQTFDKAWIIENEAEILGIADNLNYDFDVGIERLNAIRVIDDFGTSKVVMDYAASPGVENFIEIDPNYTLTVSNGGYASTSGNCSQSFSNWSANNNEMFSGMQPNDSSCYRGVLEWDISSIPDTISITDVSVVLTFTDTITSGGWHGANHDLMPVLNEQPSNPSSNAALGTDIAAGTPYVSNIAYSGLSIGTDYTYDLGSAADTDLQNQLSDDWFALGGVLNDETDSGGNFEYADTTYSGVVRQLVVTYAVVPTVPLNLATTTGIPIELTWDASADDGGSAITGYKVYRTDNQFALTDMPDSKGSDAQIDMAANEILLHLDGIEGTGNNGLLAYYKMNDASGNIANTGSITGIDGTPSGDPTYSQTGKVGDAITFDGVGDEFTLGTTNGAWNFLHDNSDFSVSWWMKMDGTPSEWQGIMGTGIGGSSIGFEIAVNPSTGQLYALNENGSGAASNLNSASGFVPSDGAWHQYTVTFSNGVWTIYRDGGSTSETVTDVISWSSSNHSRSMELGNANANTPGDRQDLTGTLDDVSLWNRVLNTAEIAVLYSDGSPTVGAGATPTTPQTSGTTIEVPVETGMIGDGSFNNRITNPKVTLQTTALPDNTDDWTVAGWFSTPTSGLGDKTIWRLNDIAVQIGQSADTSQLTTTTLQHDGSETISWLSTVGYSYCPNSSPYSAVSNPTALIAFDMVPLQHCTNYSTQFDISSIATAVAAGNTISKVEVVLDVGNNCSADGCGDLDIFGVDSSNTAMSSVSYSTLHNKGNGNVYTDDYAFSVGSQTIDLGADAITDLESSLTNGVFRIGSHSGAYPQHAGPHDSGNTYTERGVDPWSGGTASYDLKVTYAPLAGSAEVVKMTSGSAAHEVDHASSSDVYAAWLQSTYMQTGWLIGEGSSLIGVTTDTVEFDLKKAGGIPSGSNSFSVRVYDSSDSIKSEYQNTCSSEASSIGTGYSRHSVTIPSVTLAEGDRIVVRCEGTSSNNGLAISGFDAGSASDRDYITYTRCDSGTATSSCWAGNDIFAVPDMKVIGMKPFETPTAIVQATGLDGLTSEGTRQESIDVTWDASTCVGCSVNGDTITSTASGWYTGIGRATETISASVGGTLAFTSTSPNTQNAPGTNTMIGLGAGALNNGAGGKVWHDVEYGFTDQDIIENGSQLSPDTAFTRSDSDVMKIVMSNTGQVTYYINEGLVHTSTLTASGDYYPLFTSYETGETMTAPVDTASSLGTEHHYSFTRDGNTWSVYQDGALEATATSTETLGSNVPVTTSGSYSGEANSGATNSEYIGYNSGQHRAGLVLESGSDLIGVTPTSIEFEVKRNGLSGSSHADCALEIWQTPSNSASDLMYTDIFQCDTKIGTGYAWVDFGGSSGYTLKEGDHVVLRSDGGTTNNLLIHDDRYNDAFDGSATTWAASGMWAASGSPNQYPINWVNTDPGGSAIEDVLFKITGTKVTTTTPSYIIDFAGTMDEFVVKDTADSASEVLAAYNQQDFTKYTDSNVVGGESYYYYTTALNSLGEGDATSTLFGSASVVPGAPTNLAGITGMPIELSWTAASNTYASTPITHYSIERSTDGGNTWSLACVACDDIGNVLVYSDNNVSGGTTYDYRVFAHNLIGSGPASNTESTQAGVAPDPPTNVATQIQNPNTNPLDVRVTWTSPTNVGTGTLSNFEVWRDDGSGYSLITTTGLVNLYDDTVPSDNISPGYTYKVLAVSNHGTSTDSNTSNIGTPGVPLAVTNLATAQTQTEKIVLTWTASAGFVPVNHEIFRNDGSGAVKIDTIGNVLTYTNNLLSSEAGDTFTYHVVATNAAGSSPDSSTSQITAWDIPEAPVLSGQAGVPIVISWTTPASDDAITGYKIYKDGTLLTSVLVVTTYSDSAVSGGVTYSYEVSAVSATGEGTKSTAVSVIGGTAPGAPTNLSVTAVAGQLDLSWTAPGNNGGVAISGYKIERSTDNANWTDLVANTGSTITTYPDSTTTDGTTYYYKISAINSVGTGPASSTVSELAGDVPDAPAAPTVTAIAGSDITIAWTTPDGNGYAVSKEEIHYSTDGGSTWNILVQDLTTPSHTHENLTNGQTYHYKTKSYNALGWSAFSSDANTSAGDIPDALASITITALPGSEIKLDWSAPADNSYAISGYEIKRSTDGGSTFTALTTVTLLTHTDPNLTNGATYHYKIYPVNALGTQTSSPTVNEKAGDVPGNVTNFTATSVSATEIDLSWTASDANGYTVSYKIEISPDSTTWTTEVASQSGTTYSDTSLTEDTTYYYRIIPSNALGNGATSSEVNAATFGKPSPPASVTVTTASTTALDLSWTASAGNGYAITGYKIEQTADGGTTWTTVTSDTGNTNLTYSVTSLNSNSEYEYRIYGISSYGTSATASTPQAGVTLPDGPTNLVLTVIDDANIKLDWTAPSGSVALTYKVERETAGTWGDVQTGVSAVTFTDTGLSAVTEYTYRVSATNTGGYGTTSNEESATTFGVPDQPSAPTLTALAGSEIKIDWTAPADNGEVITNYKVEKSTDGSTWTLLTTVSGSTLTHTDSGLTNGSTYYYRIIAVNAIGDSPASAATTAVAGDVPSKPATPVLTAQVGSQIKVDWTAPASNGYAITSYTLEHSTDGTTWTTETTGNFLTYTDTQLTNASTHYYRVTATNGIGDSVVSDSVSVVAGDVPNVPTNLVITPSPLAASLTWSAPNNNGYAISTYLVERATDGVTFTTVGTPAITSFGDSNLTVGTTYTYRISATNALGTGTAVSGTVLGGDVPGTPALSVTSDGIATWTAPADNSYAITGYNVYLDGTLITTTTGLTYTYTGLSSGTAYTSDVKAVNSLGESASSQQTFTTVPDAVTNLAFSAASVSAINLSWTAPSGLVSSYTIERDGGIIATNHQTTTYSDTSGLQSTTGYVYDVIAINAGGQSAKATVTAATLPEAPTNVAAQAQSDTAITLTWTNPTGGPTALDGFKIERSLDAGTTWTTLVADTGNVNNQYSDSGLTSLTTYHYRLYSLNLGGTSGVSGTVNEETFGPPDAIADLGSTVTPSAINLSWTAPDANGATITSYMVEVISISTGNWITLDSNVNTNSYTHSVLVANTEYSFRVTSTNLYGTSGLSNIHAVYSLPSAPAAPTLSGNTDVIVSWNTVSGLTYRAETSTDQTNWSTLSTTQPYTHTGINPGTTVYYRLFAINTSGDSSPSATVSVTTLGMPNAPTNLTFTNPTPMSVLLDWDAPTTGGTVDSYKVQFSTDNFVADVQTLVTGHTTTTYTYTSTAYSSPHYFRIISTNGQGDSSPTSSVTYTTPDLPTAPASLTGEPKQQNTAILLDWNAPSNTYGYAISGYMIERNVNGGGWQTTVTNTQSSTTAYTQTSLTEGLTYQYRVSAITAVGTGPSSNTISVDLYESSSSVSGSAVGGNTVSITPVIDNSNVGQPSSSVPDINTVKLYENNAKIDEVGYNNLPLANGPHTFNDFYAYPDATSDYYVVIDLSNGDTIQSNTISLTPSNPFAGEFTLLEQRTIYASLSDCTNDGGVWTVYTDSNGDQQNTCTLDYDDSELNLLVQPMGSDVLVKWQSADVTEDPIIKSFTNVQGNLTTTVDLPNPDKDYYVSVYIQPEFQYTDDGAGNAIIPCELDSDGKKVISTCVDDDIPTGYRSDKALKSVSDPLGPRDLGVESMAPSGLFGMPLVFIFIIGLAAVFTGRSAQMGSIFLLITIGVMAYLGYITFDFGDQSNAITWALMIFIAIVGVLIGKRWS